MERILVIGYYFPPVGGSGVQRTRAFVQYLPAAGYLPVVVAGPRTQEDHWATRDASLVEGIPAEVEVVRVEGPAPAAGRRWRSRAERWMGAESRFAKWWIRSATDLAVASGEGARLIFATMSPFETATVARDVSRRRKIPWVADLRDPWALDETQLFPTVLHRKLELSRMAGLLSSAALIVMNTAEAANALRSACPRLRNIRVVTITNGFDAGDFLREIPTRTGKKFRILHSGAFLTNIGRQLREHAVYRMLAGVEGGVDIYTRSPATLLRAVDQWCSRRPEVAENLEIIFAGNATDDDRELAAPAIASRLIRFTGYVPHTESIELLRTADLLFLPMHNLPSGKRSRSIPGKTYEYMASGRPILGAVPDGDARDLLTACGTALLCRPDDADGMVRQLDRAYSAWKNGQTVGQMDSSFVQQFERRRLARALGDAFREVLC